MNLEETVELCARRALGLENPLFNKSVEALRSNTAGDASLMEWDIAKRAARAALEYAAEESAKRITDYANARGITMAPLFARNQK